MKCENCGKNEVTFVYRSNINGKVEEKHLCAECAEKLGYTKALARSRSRMNSLFGEGLFGESLFGGSLLDSFFSPLPALMGRMLDDPFDDFFSDMPALGASGQERKEEKDDSLVEKEERSRIQKERKVNALRLEMKRAAESEDFERAAQIRDQLRALENQENQ